MNEHEAEKRIRRAVMEKTAFLDELPSQEKEILERIPTEDETMTIAYGKTGVFPTQRRKTGWQGWIRPLAAACAMVLLAACIGLWMNGANRPDEVKSTAAMQPEETPGMAAAVPAGTEDGKEAAAAVPLDRVDLDVDPALLYDPENGLLTVSPRLDATQQLQLMTPFLEKLTENIGSLADTKIGTLVAPINAGDVVGTVEYKVGDSVLFTSNLYADRDVKEGILTNDPVEPEVSVVQQPQVSVGAPLMGTASTLTGEPVKESNLKTILLIALVGLFAVVLIAFVAFMIVVRIRRERRRKARAAARRRKQQQQQRIARQRAAERERER